MAKLQSADSILTGGTVQSGGQRKRHPQWIDRLVDNSNRRQLDGYFKLTKEQATTTASQTTASEFQHLQSLELSKCSGCKRGNSYKTEVSCIIFNKTI